MYENVIFFTRQILTDFHPTYELNGAVSVSSWYSPSKTYTNFKFYNTFVLQEVSP